MRARISKSRLLAGAFVITTVAWSIDMLTASGPVQTADAAQHVTTSTAARIVDPPDRELLERFLFQEQAYGELSNPSPERRDPFRREPGAAAPDLAAAQHPGAASADATRPGDLAPVDRPPFESRHRLGGVVLGKRSIALIDGRPFTLGDSIDEMTILEIRRDYIVLSGPGGELRLDVPRAGAVRPSGEAHPPP